MTPRPITRLNAPVSQPFPIVATTDDAKSGEHVEDLIAGYALGALEPDERLAVERHAGYCPSCARLLAETRRTAAMLPFVAAPAGPSPDVKAALFARISQSSAAVTAEQADEFAWARPVSPRKPVILPESGTWLESLPASGDPARPVALRSRRSRRSLGQIAGVSLPVLLTFGLLALFVVPQILPSDDPGNPQLADLLNSGSSECAGQFAMDTSASIASACYTVNGTSVSADGSTWSLQISNVVDDTPRTIYDVNIPTIDGSYIYAGPIVIDRQGQGSDEFTKPLNAANGSLCLTEPGQVANEVCPMAAMTPAA